MGEAEVAGVGCGGVGAGVEVAGGGCAVVSAQEAPVRAPGRPGSTCGSYVAEDHRPSRGQCWGSPPRLSGIARFLEERRSEAKDVEEQLEASMADNLDSVLRAEHALSERYRPRAAELVMAMPTRRRAELISWMSQSFDILHLEDHFLHSVTLTLDRYYARQCAPVEDSLLQYVLLSAVCTELKTAGGDEFPENRWKRLITHLCQGRVPLTMILQTESQVLSRLDYIVGLPTPVTFLHTLGIRLRGEPLAPMWFSLATFLLELALLDPELEYDYPHAHLGAGALGAAFRVLDAPAVRHEELIEDVSEFWPAGGGTLPGARRTAELVADCEEDLLGLWLRCAMGIGDLACFFSVLQAKYSRQNMHCVGLLHPADAVRRLREEREERMHLRGAGGSCSGRNYRQRNGLGKSSPAWGPVATSEAAGRGGYVGGVVGAQGG
mmetsp:Transcript_81148/g.173629  ORF Transcript_81148/g.173629 Transcript_81148/m.173629 type:complete len:437 (-) Transcript_81148:126-1436(-)